MIFLSLFFIYFKVDLEDKRKVFSHTCSISFVAASMLFHLSNTFCIMLLWIFYTQPACFLSPGFVFFSLLWILKSLSIPPNNRVMNHAVCYSEAMRCHFSSFSFFFNDKAHSTHISFFIQLAYVFFYIIFALLFFPSYIFPHRIYADSFFVTERGIKLEVSTTLIESGCPKHQATHLVHLTSFLLLCSKSTCSLNSDVQKPVVSLRRQALSVPFILASLVIALG